MTKVRVSPSRIFGECLAGHQMGDEIMIDRTTVHIVKGPICYIAMSAFADQVTQIQRHERVTSHLSCPGCCFDVNKRTESSLSLAATMHGVYPKSSPNTIGGGSMEEPLKPLNTTVTYVGSSLKKVTTLKLNERLIKPSSI